MNTVTYTARRYWKAIIGFVAPGAVVVGASVLEGSDGGSAITQAELVTALVACVVTAAGVAAKGNLDPADVAGDGGAVALDHDEA